MGGTIAKEVSSIALRQCTLWKCDRSPACRAVMMALDAMNLSVNEVDVSMESGDHKSLDIAAMNNLQTLPILKDNNLILSDSHAINSYLVSQYSYDRQLLPRDPRGRSQVEQLLHYNSGVLYPKFKAAANPILYDDCKHVMPQQVADIENSYSDLEYMLLGRNWFSNCPWPMLSDISICATVSTLNIMVPIDRHRFPKLCAWLQRMSEQLFYVTGNKRGLNDFSRRIGELELL